MTNLSPQADLLSEVLLVEMIGIGNRRFLRGEPKTKIDQAHAFAQPENFLTYLFLSASLQFGCSLIEE